MDRRLPISPADPQGAPVPVPGAAPARDALAAPYLSGCPRQRQARPPHPGRQREGGRAALLLLGRAAAQRRRYRNWLRLQETPASGGREAGAGRRCGVRSEPFIQEYPGLFLLRLPPAASPRHRPARPQLGRAPRRPRLDCSLGRGCHLWAQSIPVPALPPPQGDLSPEHTHRYTHTTRRDPMT